MEAILVQKKAGSLTKNRRWGLLFLLGAYGVFFSKCLPGYWPVIALGFLGSVSTFWFERKGFIFSLIALGLSTPFLFYSSPNPLWFLLFFASLGLSWFLIYSEGQELCLVHDAEKRHLEQQLTRVETEKECFSTSYLQSEKTLERLSQENTALQKALQEAQTYSRQLESQQISSALEEPVEERLHLSELEQQYAELKQHFQTKATALDAARKELFKTEGALILLQKQWEENNLEPGFEVNKFVQDLHLLEEERDVFVAQVAALEELVSLLIPFARTKLS